VITPLLLPWLPGRAFAVKGILPGIAGAIFFVFLRSSIEWAFAPGFLDPAAWLLMVPAISSYLAMNFTGCSTFTSLSGVKKEMKWAVPLQAAALATGIILWFVSGFF
jgi:acetyl-CoA decarbonylase/synthase complex subunit gamma